jgi:hypothetical protein
MPPACAHPLYPLRFPILQVELTHCGHTTVLCMPKPGRFPTLPAAESTKAPETVSVNVNTAASTPDDPARYGLAGAAVGAASGAAAVGAAAASKVRRNTPALAMSSPQLKGDVMEADQATPEGVNPTLDAPTPEMTGNAGKFPTPSNYSSAVDSPHGDVPGIFGMSRGAGGATDSAEVPAFSGKVQQFSASPMTADAPLPDAPRAAAASVPGFSGKVHQFSASPITADAPLPEAPEASASVPGFSGKVQQFSASQITADAPFPEPSEASASVPGFSGKVQQFGVSAGDADAASRGIDGGAGKAPDATPGQQGAPGDADFDAANALTGSAVYNKFYGNKHGDGHKDGKTGTTWFERMHLGKGTHSSTEGHAPHSADAGADIKLPTMPNANVAEVGALSRPADPAAPPTLDAELAGREGLQGPSATLDASSGGLSTDKHKRGGLLGNLFGRSKGTAELDAPSADITMPSADVAGRKAPLDSTAVSADAPHGRHHTGFGAALKGVGASMAAATAGAGGYGGDDKPSADTTMPSADVAGRKAPLDSTAVGVDAPHTGYGAALKGVGASMATATAGAAGYGDGDKPSADTTMPSSDVAGPKAPRASTAVGVDGPHGRHHTGFGAALKGIGASMAAATAGAGGYGGDDKPSADTTMPSADVAGPKASRESTAVGVDAPHGRHHTGFGAALKGVGASMAAATAGAGGYSGDDAPDKFSAAASGPKGDASLPTGGKFESPEVELPSVKPQTLVPSDTLNAKPGNVSMPTGSLSVPVAGTPPHCMSSTLFVCRFVPNMLAASILLRYSALLCFCRRSAVAETAWCVSSWLIHSAQQTESSMFCLATRVAEGSCIMNVQYCVGDTNVFCRRLHARYRCLHARWQRQESLCRSPHPHCG